MISDVLLHLSLIEGVGPAAVQKIMHSVDDLRQLYDWDEHTLMRRCAVSPSMALCITKGLKNRSLLERARDQMQAHGISWISCVDTNYPEPLKQITCPPIGLYVQGELHNAMVALVGSRNGTHYARSIIDAWVPQFIEAGWGIVSGGARGVDTMAHKATVQAQGKTVAVLGSGLLRPYPQENTELFKNIVARGGAIVSPFALDMEPKPGNFPARNRIIAGLSQAVVVVQAAQKSGARITAEYALEQGRLVCAVPGSIFEKLSAGCHALIQEGATPLTGAGQLLQEIGGYVQSTTFQKKVTEQQCEIQQSIKKEHNPVQLAPVAESIVICCTQQAQSFDDLLELTSVQVHELQDHLFDLQLAGLIEQNAAGLWCAL